MKRRTVLFSGHVQGVGFRFTTCRIAESFKVTGCVRNLPDGRVELIAEGADAEVTRFLATLESEMQSNIRNRVVAESPATGEYSDFNVAY
jgi:acylphosphatase